MVHAAFRFCGWEFWVMAWPLALSCPAEGGPGIALTRKPEGVCSKGWFLLLPSTGSG
jgi:hypothetical protein